MRYQLYLSVKVQWQIYIVSINKIFYLAEKKFLFKYQVIDNKFYIIIYKLDKI